MSGTLPAGVAGVLMQTAQLLEVLDAHELPRELHDRIAHVFGLVDDALFFHGPTQ